MQRPQSSSRGSRSDAATAIALLGLVVLAAGLLGLMALVLPQLLGIVIVILIFAVPAALHYLAWGWWMSQIRDEELEREKREQEISEPGVRSSESRRE